MMDAIRTALNDSSGQQKLLIVTTLVVVIISTQLRTVIRAVSAFLSRLYLNFVIVPRKSSSDTAKVSGLFIHPVKSLRAVSVKEAAIDTKGFVDDRRFMVVIPAPLPPWGSFGPKDATHRFLTQRQCPSLARVVAELKDGKLILSSDILPKTSVTVPLAPLPGAQRYRATLWSDIVDVQDMGEEASAFLQKIVEQDDSIPDEMKTNVRLVVQATDDGRKTDDNYVPASARTYTGSSPSVMLSDGFPVLLATEASLEELNRRLKEKEKKPLPMSRFRPNIVIKGTKPFEEDTWKVISIDGVIFHVVKGCPRCKQSCTDQTTGEVTEEPLETMAEFRALDPNNGDNIYFAQNAIPALGSTGKVISVGSSVKVLQRGEPVWGD